MHTVKLITFAKHTVSRSNSGTEQRVSYISICLSFNSITRGCSPITQRRQNNSLMLCFNKSCFVMCTFVWTFPRLLCSSKDGDCCGAFISKKERKRFLQCKHPWLNIKGFRYFKTDTTSKALNTFKGYHRKEIQKPASHL